MQDKVTTFNKILEMTNSDTVANLCKNFQLVLSTYGKPKVLMI